MDLVVRISTTDDWLYLNEGVFKVSAEALGEEATTWRRSEVTNPNVEGAWIVNALRENTTMPLSIWVRGDEYMTTAEGIEVLKAAFSQINYILEVTMDGDRYTYTCYVADFSVKAQRELRHAAMAQFSAEVPRHPAYVLEYV